MIDTQHEVAVIWSLDFDAELPCESHHRSWGNEICSKIAVAYQQTCDRDFMICENQMKWAVGRMQEGMIHSSCYKPALECWSIRPI